MAGLLSRLRQCSPSTGAVSYGGSGCGFVDGGDWGSIT
jgi:hypothetical protein